MLAFFGAIAIERELDDEIRPFHDSYQAVHGGF